MNIIQLSDRLKAHQDRNCKGKVRTFLAARPKTRQARENEQLCATCPALNDCAEYVDAMERWQKQGTMAGTTYSRKKSPSYCEWCSAQFYPKKLGRTFCSNSCRASRQNQLRGA